LREIALSKVDDPMFRGDAVNDPRVPVVEDRGQVGEEDHRDAGLRAELSVGEIYATGGDGARALLR
jgi:hypothetical protein